MKRRQFIGLLGAAAAWPAAARAQQPAMPVIGFLNGQVPAEVTSYMAAFRKGLAAAGFVEGRNVTIEYRWAEGRRDRLAALAADLVQRQVNLLVTTGGTPGALAAKAATTTVPIVFAVGADPVGLGLVASLNRPGGNATGASHLFNALGAKRLELLRELVPSVRAIGYLASPTNPSFASETDDMQAAIRALGLTMHLERASHERDLEPAFVRFAGQRVDALIIAADVLFTGWRDQLVALAARHALPASYHTREIVEAGGLFCYGPSQSASYHQAGVYAGRILQGEKPSDLPVMQSTKFELVINLKTAKALGIEVPPTLLALADEVIE